MSTNEERPRPEKPDELDAQIAAFLGQLIPRPDGYVSVTEFAALLRASLGGAKQREHATRKAVIESLGRLGIPLDETYDHRRCIVGYSIDPTPALVVDASGRIREAA
jgi:hypothetical protein